MRRLFCSADGELLIVPQEGALLLATEFGRLACRTRRDRARAARREVPRRGRRALARGYVCENYGAPFRLPELGPIGSNGLASPRDFLAPCAAFEDVEEPTDVVAKLAGHLWSVQYDHSPLDVVAWHGNYHPCKYDLARFNAINTVSFDHPDPSIFTVLTSPSDTPGTANVDFVIFPPRWTVAEHTFRPPYFHRNAMSELMGLVRGAYDAKRGGFLPGGASLHNAMTAHGPDRASYEAAVAAKLAPQYLGDTLAFMFESRYLFEPTAFAMNSPAIDREYDKVWDGFAKATLSPGRGSGEARLPQGAGARRHARRRGPRPRPRRRGEGHRGHDAAGPRELGRGPAASRRTRGVDREGRRARRARFRGGARRGPRRRAAAPRLRVARRLRIPLARRARSPRAQRQGARELLPRSAHVPGRRGPHDGRARPDPRAVGGMGRGPRRRGGGPRGRRADGRDRRRSRARAFASSPS